MTDKELDALIERMKRTSFDDMYAVYLALKAKLPPGNQDLELLMEFSMMGLGSFHAAKDAGMIDQVLAVYKLGRRNRLN